MSIDSNFIIIVAIAAAAAQAFSCFWYSPKILGSSWMQLCGIKPADCKDCGKKMLITFCAYFAMAVTLFMILVWAGATDARTGLAAGTWLGLGIVGTSLLITHLWEGRSPRLFLITAGNLVFSVILMCTLMGHLTGIFFGS